MNEQQKIKRTMRLIKLMLEGGKSVVKLESLLEVSKATIYRYFELLTDLGYAIDKDFHGNYFIFNPTFHQNTVFSADEIVKLKHLLDYINNPLFAQSVTQKLDGDNLYPSSEFIQKINNFTHLQLLSEAIRQKKWLKLIKYHSSNSNSIKDKIIFPLKFSDRNPKYLVALEAVSGEQRIFKTFRIEGIEELNPQLPIPHIEQILEIDLFGMTNAPEAIVKLQLTERAKSLLEEEYPQVLNLIEQTSNQEFPYRLILAVLGFEGIGRFILSLPGEIVIENQPALEQYLKEKMNKYTFLTN